MVSHRSLLAARRLWRSRAAASPSWPLLPQQLRAATPLPATLLRHPSTLSPPLDLNTRQHLTTERHILGRRLPEGSVLTHGCALDSSSSGARGSLWTPGASVSSPGALDRPHVALVLLASTPGSIAPGNGDVGDDWHRPE
jgi:hypothetical protein